MQILKQKCTFLPEVVVYAGKMRFAEYDKNTTQIRQPSESKCADTEAKVDALAQSCGFMEEKLSFAEYDKNIAQMRQRYNTNTRAL